MCKAFSCHVIIMNMIPYTREYAVYIPYANSVLSELKLKAYLVSKSGFIFIMHKFYCFKAGNLKVFTKRLHLLIRVYTWCLCLESSYQLIVKLRHLIVVLKYSLVDLKRHLELYGNFKVNLLHDLFNLISYLLLIGNETSDECIDEMIGHVALVVIIGTAILKLCL